jgi:hypothetical protein
MKFSTSISAHYVAANDENKWRPDASDLHDYAMNVEPLYRALVKVTSRDQAEDLADVIIREYNTAMGSMEARKYKGNVAELADVIMENLGA